MGQPAAAPLSTSSNERHVSDIILPVIVRVSSERRHTKASVATVAATQKTRLIHFSITVIERTHKKESKKKEKCRKVAAPFTWQMGSFTCVNAWPKAYRKHHHQRRRMTHGSIALCVCVCALVCVVCSVVKAGQAETHCAKSGAAAAQREKHIAPVHQWSEQLAEGCLWRT